MNVELTLSCGDYDLTRALIDDVVRPKGIDLVTLDYPTPERNWRMARNLEFDVCELSMGSYLTALARGEEMAYTAIPVFPHRRFRHSYYFTYEGSGVEDPGDLAGGRVGLRIWQNTASIWMRGIAAEQYGLDLERVTWVLDDEEDEAATIPDRFDVEAAPAGTDIEQLLVEEELDAVFYPVVLGSAKDPTSNVRRVFEDSLAAEQAYYEETGIFPIMHTVVVKNEVIERFPWVPVNVYLAFVAARDWGLEQLEDPRWTALAWARQHLEHQQAVLGRNPWPYGLTEENRHALETLQSHAVLAGIIDEPVDLEAMFAASTLDPAVEEKGYVSGL